MRKGFLTNQKLRIPLSPSLPPPCQTPVFGAANVCFSWDEVNTVTDNCAVRRDSIDLNTVVSEVRSKSDPSLEPGFGRRNVLPSAFAQILVQ